MKNNLKIEVLPVAKLIPYATNARTHSDEQVAQIAGSIREFGFTNPVLIDAENGIIAGHGRVLAARKLDMTSVPCLRLSHLTETQRRAYVIADNQLALNAGWDEKMLAVELAALREADFDLSLTGFDGDAIEAFLNPPGDETDADAEPQIDKSAELNKVWQVKAGDLWRVGEHRLLCGDSTKTDDVARVMGGDELETVMFDPEWDEMPPAYAAKTTLAFCDCATVNLIVERYGAPTWLFVWDCVSSWFTPNRPLRRGKLCLWYGDISNFDMDGAHYGDAGAEREVFNSRGSYTFKPDPRGKHLSDVFSLPITKLHADSDHSHSKPSDWVRMLIGDCTSGDVFDPFLGSGTTMVACENLGRKCRGIEISPDYCAVILDRMQRAFPGIEIKKVEP